MRSPLISVTLGFFSVTGGCSSIGDFPSWAMTVIPRVNSNDKRTTTDFILAFLCVWQRHCRLDVSATRTLREGRSRELPSLTVGLLTRGVQFQRNDVFDEHPARQSCTVQPRSGSPHPD